LADALGLPVSNSVEDLKRRILGCFDSRMLLVVDECEECISDKARSSRGIDTLNFIREIHDKRKCGVVLAGANIFKKRLTHGAHSLSLVRLVRRGMPPLQLPSLPSQADLAIFAAHFGLPPVPDALQGVRVTHIDDDGEERRVELQKNPLQLQTETVREHGLGRWIMILTEASDTAREKRKTITWGFVIHAWHTFEAAGTFAADSQKEAA
jgi:DNA transposition AAA+ family ATPase